MTRTGFSGRAIPTKQFRPAALRNRRLIASSEAEAEDFAPPFEQFRHIPTKRFIPNGETNLSY